MAPSTTSTSISTFLMSHGTLLNNNNNCREHAYWAEPESFIRSYTPKVTTVTSCLKNSTPASHPEAVFNRV